MTNEAPPRQRRPSGRSWLGIIAAGVAGIVVCLVLALFSAYVTMYSDLVVTGIVFTVLALGPALALWRTHSRYWYGVAAGIVVGWVAVVGLFGVLSWMDEGANQDRIDRATQEIRASGTPVYYLGRSYAGLDLTDVEAAGSNEEMPEDGAFFAYGDCDGGGSEGGCGVPVEVQNGSMDSLSGGALRGCARVDDVRGVPTILWGDDGLLLFTQDSTVTVLADYAHHDDLRSMAEALRPVSGPADVTKPLPAPTKDILDTITKNCGAE